MPEIGVDDPAETTVNRFISYTVHTDGKVIQYEDNLSLLFM
jgi:hypothetical protein